MVETIEDDEEENVVIMGLHKFVDNLSPMEEEFDLGQLAFPFDRRAEAHIPVEEASTQTRIAIRTLHRPFSHAALHTFRFILKAG